jgi:predicted RNA methylase
MNNVKEEEDITLVEDITFIKDITFDKELIVKSIKNISLETVEREMNKLIKNGSNNMADLSPLSRVGNNIVDYFTFKQRLETRGKYNVNFYEFVANIDEFKKKKFIQNMLTYYKDVKNKNNTKTEYTVLKEVYNICISAINIMRPLTCMEIYKRFNAKRVLNFCAGWGGSTIAAAACNIEAFYGVEINSDLKVPYDKMVPYLKTKSQTNIEIFICDAATFDYSALKYDTVFSSPPYYFIEKYANNPFYRSKTEMDENFYIPVFSKTYTALQKGGHYIINVCKEVYDRVLVKLFGEAHILIPYKKFKRQNDYSESIYVWLKNE